MSEYTIHGGDKGSARLAILQQTVGPDTARFLDDHGDFKPGMDCLELGSGTGYIALDIARRVYPGGHVTGIDIDVRNTDNALRAAANNQQSNITFRTDTAHNLEANSKFDRVYMRFLLSHLKDPGVVLARAFESLKSGGKILLEDTDFSGHFSNPQSDHFDTYVSLYQQLLTKRGADANIGQKLVQMLKNAGFVHIQFRLSQPVHTAGAGKLMAEITFDGISNSLLQEGFISSAEAEQILAGLIELRKREDSMMSLPRIFQVCGTKS